MKYLNKGDNRIGCYYAIIVIRFTKPVRDSRGFTFSLRFCFSPRHVFSPLLCRSDTGMGLQFQGRLHFCQSGLVLNNSLRTHWHGVTWMNEMWTAVREKRKLQIIKSELAVEQYLHLQRSAIWRRYAESINNSVYNQIVSVIQARVTLAFRHNLGNP